jgi:ABC transporter ATM
MSGLAGWRVVARPAGCAAFALAGPSRSIASKARPPLSLQPLAPARTRALVPASRTPSLLASFTSSAVRAEPRQNGADKAAPAAAPKPAAPAVNPDVASGKVSEKKQAVTDWRILRQLASNVWPKGNTKIKVRVITALSLLVAGKVLNVQVPFFFKAIIDSLNVPITSDTSLWVVAGASIAGCESPGTGIFVADGRRPRAYLLDRVRRDA